MGCVASNNQFISGKVKSDNNNYNHLLSLTSYQNKNTLFSLDNRQRSLRNNSLNHSYIYKIPQLNSEYNILEQLSFNEMSVDYKLQLKSDNSKYKTLKILSRTIMGNEKKILKEIETLNSLRNDKFLRIEQCYYDSMNYYVIMEYCSLGKLTDLLKKYLTLTENQVKVIIYQLLEIVLFLSSKSLVHTDIKPDNIFIYSSYIYEDQILYLIKLLNFGSSTYMKKSTSQNSQSNLPFYVAPEIFENNFNIKNDIWSIGVIMFEMLFGFIPFCGDNYAKVVFSINNAKINFDRHDNLSENCIDLLKNMLIRNPEHRFDVNQCISHIWFKDIDKLLIDKVNNNKDYKTNINIKNKENIIKEDFKTFIKDLNLQIKSPLSIKINSKRNVNRNNYVEKDLIYQTFKYIHHYLRKQFNLNDEMDYLKKLFDKNKNNDLIDIEKTLVCFKKYCGYNNNLINDLILDDQISDKLKNEVNEGKLNLIQFQNFLIKEKGNDINDKLWKAFSNLDINQNKNELIKCLNEVQENSKLKKYFNEIINEMNNHQLKENYLFFEYKGLIENAVNKIENEKISNKCEF